MKKRLSNFFLFLSEKLTFWVIILVPIAIFMCFQLEKSSGAFIPPTQEDYKWLHEQEEKIKEDFTNVYSIEGVSIEMQEKEIKVILVSSVDSNYELHMTFDKNIKFVKSKEVCQKMGFRTYSTNPKIEKYMPTVSYIIFGSWGGISGAIGLQSLYRIVYDLVKIMQERKKNLKEEHEDGKNKD